MNAGCVFLALGLTLVLLPHRGSAQVVATPEGTVEFIGLERWTIEMIRDSMAVKAPGEPLGRCAAFLVQVGFPTANALYLSGENGKPYILVTVVEPHRADRVRTRSSFRDSLPDHLEWKKGINLFHEKNPTFQHAVQFAGMRHDTARVREVFIARQGDADIQQFWSFLNAQGADADRDQALWTLENDRNWINRTIAAAILTNFGESDRVWWSLMDAQRDSVAAVAATAAQALAALARNTDRAVDWSPAVASIRDLLNGTNVFLYEGVLATLIRTRVSPWLAPTLLRNGGGDLLLAYLRAHHPHARKAAREFLVHLAGMDHGSSPEAWKHWTDGLKSK